MGLKEKKKHKKDEKKEKDCSVYTRKKCEKYCSTSHLKNCKHPFYMALKEKRKHKIDEKGRGGYSFFEGSRTGRKGSKSSIYKGLRRKETKKGRKRL